MNVSEVLALSSKSLAFLGDSVHSAYVREAILKRSDVDVNELARFENRYVCARAQANMCKALTGFLSDTEESVVRRAINAKTNNKAKNAARHEYRLATGYEALLGFLRLTENEARLKEILEKTNREEFIVWQ